MTEILSSIAKSIYDNDFDKNDFKVMSLVFHVLATNGVAQIKSGLDQLKSSGVDLRKMGTVALIGNRKPIADALRTHFDVKIEDYLTNDSEMGMDGIEGYPLLASLAYFSNIEACNELQVRALAWGADPGASWSVPRKLPIHSSSREGGVVSWVSENIRALNVEFTSTLCAKASHLPSREEECRRAFALWSTIGAKGETLHSGFNGLLDMFKPGGEYALSISPWDVPVKEDNLAFYNAVNHAQHNQAVPSGRARERFEGWSKSTMEGRNEECLEIANRCAMFFDSFTSFPYWVMDTLTPHQAQDVLSKSWKVIFDKWARDEMGGRSSSFYQGSSTASVAEYSLRSKIAPLERITEVAIQAPCLSGSETPEFLFAGLGSYCIEKMSPQAIDALAVCYPKFHNSPDHAASVQHIRDLLVDHQEFKTNSSLLNNPKIQAYHEACELRNAANKEAWALRKASGEQLKPSRPSPRL